MINKIFKQNQSIILKKQYEQKENNHCIDLNNDVRDKSNVYNRLEALVQKHSF